MLVHTDWSTPGFDLQPAAARVGPFPMRGFLETWWRVHGSGDLMLVSGDDALLTLVSTAGTVRFAGDADVTDYHAPLGPNAAALVAELASELDPGTVLSFDSLPKEAAAVVVSGLESAGVPYSVGRHETAMVLDLAGSYEAHLAGLGRKERHEVRRKRRRFVETFGEPRLVRGPSGLERFVSMHRASGGEKGGFMTPEMERFFGALLDLDGAVLDALVGEAGVPLAAAFGFEDRDTYYLYNSAFAEEAAGASPGIVLVDRLIAAVIEAGKTRLDFLKGEERYKDRLGAVGRPLLQVEVRR